MGSIWTKNTVLPAFPSLCGNIRADVAVIGGGMAGILTADRLRQAGADVVVLEADRVGMGQTAGTTAKLTAQHGLRYHKLLQDFGPEAAGQYARVQLTAVEQLRRLVRDRRLDCDFRDCTAYLYATGAPGTLRQEYEACRSLGMDMFLTQNTELPFPAEALGLRHQARFHPLKLLTALAEGLPIYEHTRVLEVEGHQVRTDHGTVTADTVVFTCHFPFPNFPGCYFVRQHQERSYVLALENAVQMEGMYLGVDGDKLSFRSWGKYLLLGGSGHRTGDNRQGGQYAALRQAARRFWPACRVAAAWSAQDCMPMDGVPYIGPFAASRPHWLVATGFQKWGMSSSMAAAEILGTLALGQPSQPDWAMFSPARFQAGASLRQLASDTACSIRGLSRRFLEPGRTAAEQLPPGHGGIVEQGGEKLGVYRDADGTLYAVTIKCPHLGCQLEWNPEEKSWDCPCHGSRFDFRGHLLSGPAQTDLSAR